MQQLGENSSIILFSFIVAGYNPSSAKCVCSKAQLLSSILLRIISSTSISRTPKDFRQYLLGRLQLGMPWANSARGLDGFGRRIPGGEEGVEGSGTQRDGGVKLKAHCIG